MSIRIKKKTEGFPPRPVLQKLLGTGGGDAQAALRATDKTYAVGAQKVQAYLFFSLEVQRPE